MNLPMSRRNFLTTSGKIALGASAAGSLLAACGPGGGGTATISTGDTIKIGNGKVVLWAVTTDPGRTKYFKEQDIDAFNATRKDVNVEVVYKSSDSVESLLRAALAAKKGPDIVGTQGPSYAIKYINSNYFLDLERYAKIFKWEDKFLPWALDTGKLNNKLYAMPNGYESMFILYIKPVFEKHGWKPPTNRSELEALAEDMQSKGVIPFANGNADWQPMSEWFVTAFFNHYAGPEAVYQALTGKLSWKDPVFVEAITLLNSYFQKGWVGGGVKQYLSNGFVAIDNGLVSGKYGMYIEGTWGFQELAPYLEKAGLTTDDIGWIPIPPLRDGVPQELYALSVGDTRSISTTAQDPDAAALYLDWLYSTPERMVKEMTDQYLDPPPVKMDFSQRPAGVDKNYWDTYIALQKATSEGTFGYTTWTFWPAKTDVFTYQGLDKVLIGDMKPEEFCAQHDEIFQEELSKGQVPIPPKGKI